MSKPAKSPKKKPEKDVQLIAEPSRAIELPTDAQREIAADLIQQEKTRPSRVDSEVFGTSLCEFVPKQTWVVDDSYVHPEWYLKREEARKNRAKPWQTAGLTQRWRESGQFRELEKKTSDDLGFDELDEEKLDDPHLFDFDAIEAEKAAKKKQKVVKKVDRDAYTLYHTPIEKPATANEVPDRRFHYERPVRMSSQNLQENSSPPIGVTLKAIMVDGEPAAFAACSFTGRTQRTSKEVFDQFQKCLTNCQTLLPNGPFRILPPKGINVNAIYQKKIKSKRDKAKRRKKSKAGDNKKGKQSVGNATEKNSTEHKADQYVSFGDPSEPLAFADDLLELSGKAPTERERGLKCLQLQETTNLRERNTIGLFRKCTTQEMWKRKRQRKVLQQYIKAYSTDSTCNLRKKKGEANDLTETDEDYKKSPQPREPRKTIDADDEYRTADDSSTSTNDEDTVYCYDHKFLDDFEAETIKPSEEAASEANGPPPTAFMSFSRPELHKRAKFQHVPRDDYADLASTNIHHVHHYGSEDEGVSYCQCESNWETEEDSENEGVEGNTFTLGRPLSAATPLRLKSEQKSSWAMNSLFDSKLRLPAKTLNELVRRLEMMGTFSIRKTIYEPPKKPMVSFAAHGQKLRFDKSSAKITESDISAAKQTEDSSMDEIIITSGLRQKKSLPDLPQRPLKPFPSQEFLCSLYGGLELGCPEDHEDKSQSDVEASESTEPKSRQGLEKWFYDTIVLKKIIRAPSSLSLLLASSSQIQR